MDSPVHAVGAPGASGLSDEELVRCVLAGETACYELVMRRHNARLYRAVRAIVRDETEVEDVMQQAYLSAFRHLSHFAGRARFSTWLTRIAVNEAFARARARRRFVSLEGSGLAFPEPVASDNPEETVSTREVARILEQALDALPELYSSVFVLRDMEGLSTAETAEVLSVKEETVKVRLHRARVLLRDRIFACAGASVAEAYSFHLSRCDRVVGRVLGRLGVSAP
jgi:RNA polymerase sigma-70 factor (ECF subfamily)